MKFEMRQLDIEFSTWGGARNGAGRKRQRRGRPNVAHRPRERHAKARPVHVTLRARRGLPPFRERALVRVVRDAIRAANAKRATFGVTHFSVQNDHLHLVVEAADKTVLARGVQGLAIRLAKRINATIGARGRVWSDRFHSRELATPRAVRNAIVYVLMNAKKHGAFSGGVDACSSAPWFDRFAVPVRPGREAPPVRTPATWLARIGWRRCGLVQPTERPRAPN